MNQGITIINKSETGLLPVAKKAINDLPEGLRKYALAKDSEIIAKLSLSDAECFVLDLITETQINIGHTKIANDSMTNELSAIAICKLIFDRHKTLTKAELKLAVLNGSIGEYGNYTGVNLLSVSTWIKSYNNDELKKKAMSEWNKMIDCVQINKFSEEQKEQIIVDGCLKFFKDFKESGTLKDFVLPVDHICGIFYDLLKSKGLVNFSNDRRIEIYDRALEKYTKDLNESKLRRRIKPDMHKILIDSISKKDNKPFSALCKRIALTEYFNDIMGIGEDLQTILSK